MQTVAVILCRKHKFHLFRVQSSDLFLQEQVDRHPQGGERGLQLMGYGRYDPSFEFLLLQLARDIFQDQDGTAGLLFGVKDRHGFRAEEVFFSFDESLNDGLVALGFTDSSAPDGFVEKVSHPVEGKAADADIGSEAEDLGSRFR
jgi:hypothetical protein